MLVKDKSFRDDAKTWHVEKNDNIFIRLLLDNDEKSQKILSIFKSLVTVAVKICFTWFFFNKNIRFKMAIILAIVEFGDVWTA
jgi:hypothetical protein